ncbi:MAG: hypothetical protein IPP96_04095 [Chitinophagaceae bacterium]|nr:hypothetical protein [Chitinophagaceae bacterium]
MEYGLPCISGKKYYEKNHAAANCLRAIPAHNGTKNIKESPTPATTSTAAWHGC